MVFLAELVKRDIHGVEDADDLHGPQPGTHRGKADDVTEQYGDTLKFLASVERGFPIPQLVSDRFGDHLIEQLVGPLDTLL